MTAANKRKKKRNAPPLRNILDTYDAFLRESDMSKAAAALGIGCRSLKWRFDHHPEYRLARKLAEQRRGGRATMAEYIFKRLSPEARAVWDKIEYYQGNKNTSIEKIDAMLGNKPVRVRQEIFIHALIHTNYDLSEACHMSGVSRAKLNAWRKEDLGFMQLMEEIQWHKKNFFERALIDLVENRHPGATMFVNRTVNADRGYTERIQLEHSGSVEMQGYRVEDLDLDLETREKILAAIRRKKEEFERQDKKQIKEPIDV